MALQRAVYRPRDAEHTVLHQVIAEHLEVFLHAVAEAMNFSLVARPNAGINPPPSVAREPKSAAFWRSG